MSGSKKLTKEKLLESIEKLEKNQNDKGAILGEVGLLGFGAIGGGAAAAVLGGTTASIPIITTVTGIGMAVAAPVTLVAGAAVAGSAAVYGMAKLLRDGGFNEGKRQELLKGYKDRLREIERKERQSNLQEGDKTKFHVFLKEPLKHDLISSDDALQLMQAVENGKMPLSEAYELVGELLGDEKIRHRDEVTKTALPEKIVTSCPNCAQKLRAPSHLGKLNLNCPKCKHSWSWFPQ